MHEHVCCTHLCSGPSGPKLLKFLNNHFGPEQIFILPFFSLVTYTKLNPLAHFGVSLNARHLSHIRDADTARRPRHRCLYFALIAGVIPLSTIGAGDCNFSGKAFRSPHRRLRSGNQSASHLRIIGFTGADLLNRYLKFLDNIPTQSRCVKFEFIGRAPGPKSGPA